MTKAQIWVAAFVGSFILLYFVQKLTTPTITRETKPAMGQIGSAGASSSESEDPKILLAKFNCQTCHGKDYRGGASGPSLYSLADYYGKDKLAAYIYNPGANNSEQRHRDRIGKYPVPMPNFSNKDLKEIEIIAEYLLTLK